MKTFKKFVITGCLGIMFCSLFVCHVFAVSANRTFDFRIQPYKGNTTTPYYIYRDVPETVSSVPWLVKMTESGEGAGTITTYWLELKNGQNVSTDCEAKVGIEYKTPAYNYANSQNVYLTAENNNNNSNMYTVKGYWNATSTYK